MIEFLCPNGHRIHCPEEQAGRAAKCPRCGVKFRIPSLSEADTLSPAADESEAAEPELTDSGVQPTPSGQPGDSAVGRQEIEFLCPNGHRLHGPATLQGRAGECPECGSRFRIPTYDEVSEEEGMELDISLGGADEESSSGATLSRVDRVEEPPRRPPPRQGITRERPAMAISEAGSDLTTRGHPLAKLFAKLWAEKPANEAIELHFGDGETLVPDHFLKGLSQQSHAVFAVKEPGGTYTLTAVAWESVTRVLVQGLKQLPEGTSD